MNDYFEQLSKKSSIFKNERMLDIQLFPKIIPYREKELSILSQIFLPLITNPNSISKTILILGKTGVGKSRIIKYFCKILTITASKKNVNLKSIHLNCRNEWRTIKVLYKIVHFLDPTFPRTSYSKLELLDKITELLRDQDLHIIIVLDELSYLSKLEHDHDLIYLLLHEVEESVRRISIIGITREISSLDKLDETTITMLEKNKIKFKDYSEKQLFEILKHRASISFKENVISDDLLNLISNIVYKKNGDIRIGLNLLWKAGKVAEDQNLDHITPDCIIL